MTRVATHVDTNVFTYLCDSRWQIPLPARPAACDAPPFAYRRVAWLFCSHRSTAASPIPMAACLRPLSPPQAQAGQWRQWMLRQIIKDSTTAPALGLPELPQPQTGARSFLTFRCSSLHSSAPRHHFSLSSCCSSSANRSFSSCLRLLCQACLGGTQVGPMVDHNMGGKVQENR